MSRTLDRAGAFRWALFIALLWIWPFPLFGLDGSMIPVARFVQLAASLSVLIAIEGAGGMVGALAFLLWGHVLIYGLLLFGASTIIMKHGVSRMPARVGFWFSASAIFGLLCWGYLSHPYDTAFHHSDAHASLLELYR
jgi:hypothetical protein